MENDTDNSESPASSLHIALVCARYDPRGGGAEWWTHEHAQGLVRLGHRVSIVCARARDLPPSVEAHLVTPRSGWFDCPHAAFADAAAQIAARVHADVTVDLGTACPADVLMPHFGTRVANIQVRARLRAPWRNAFRRKFPIFDLHDRRLVQLEHRMYTSDRVKRVVAVSGMVARDMAELAGVDASRIDVIHNGVDTDRYTPADSPRKSAARRALNLGEGGVCLLVAHDFRLKNVAGAIRASARLPEVTLVIVGRDPPAPYRRLARDLGCAARVRFEGAQSDVASYYHAADVLLHPTHYDPCSLVALEAAACGLPVVTTRHNGATEQLGDAAIVLDDANDDAAMASAVTRTLERGAAAEMRRAAISLRAVLDHRHALSRCAALYSAIAGVRPAPASAAGSPRESPATPVAAALPA